MYTITPEFKKKGIDSLEWPIGLADVDWALGTGCAFQSRVNGVMFSVFQGGALWTLTRLIQGRGQDRAEVLNLPKAAGLSHCSPCCGDSRP